MPRWEDRVVKKLMLLKWDRMGRVAVYKGSILKRGYDVDSLRLCHCTGGKAGFSFVALLKES